MKLRWLLRDDGTRELQVDTAYGWEAVPEVHEVEERAERQRRSEESILRQMREDERRIRESVDYLHRRTWDKFPSA